MLLESLMSVLNEELHAEIQGILDSNKELSSKHTAIAKKIRNLTANGIDTGLENGRPKKGSSRAVYFPKEHRNIEIDGQSTHLPTAVKIAFKGFLDKYKTKDEPMLGELQNNIEAEPHHNHYRVLREQGEGRYETNENGILAPVLKSHQDGHWLEMAKVHNITEKEFKNLTVNEKFPKGISHSDFKDALMIEHSISKGYNMKHYKPEILEHPLVHNYMNHMFDTGSDPSDYVKGNMGIFVHPITGHNHIVLRDYGYNEETSKAYNTLRNRAMGR